MKTRMWCVWCVIATTALAAAVLAGARGAGAAEGEPAKPEAHPAAHEEPSVVRGLTPAESAIYSELENKTKFDFIETPLADVVAFIHDLHQMPIQVDQTALTDEGISPDAPITFTSNTTLRSALTSMLKQQKLDWIVQNDMLVITTPAKAATTLSTRTYDLAPLIVDPQDATELVELVRVAKETLERDIPAVPEVIGESAQAPLPRKMIQHRYLIIVRDNRLAHEELGRVFAMLYEAKKAELAAIQAAREAMEMETEPMPEASPERPAPPKPAPGLDLDPNR